MSRLAIARLVAAALAAISIAGAAQAADVAAGKAAFGSCASCHGTDAQTRRLGPTLFGVVGRKAGAVPGYNYSPAMAASGLTWTAAALDKFIAAPKAVVPGTKMSYVGLADAKARADLVAYLATLQ